MENRPVPMKIMGIPDESTVTGNSPEIFKQYCLTPEDAAEQAKNLLGKVNS